ncbi:hypothetical protein ACFXTH_033906 [Malus domestica]
MDWDLWGHRGCNQLSEEHLRGRSHGASGDFGLEVFKNCHAATGAAVHSRSGGAGGGRGSREVARVIGSRRVRVTRVEAAEPGPRNGSERR